MTRRLKLSEKIADLWEELMIVTLMIVHQEMEADFQRDFSCETTLTQLCESDMAAVYYFEELSKYTKR